MNRRVLVTATAGMLAVLGLQWATNSESHVLGSALLASGPSNDDLANCQVIPNAHFSGETTFSGTTDGASSEAGEPNGSGSATVWYSFTATAPGLIYLVPVSDGSGTVVHAYRDPSDPSDCASASLTSLLDVGVSSANVGGSQSTPSDATVIPSIEGTTYFIQVENQPSAGAGFTYSLIEPVAGEPSNDDFDAATSLDSSLDAAAAGNGSADPAAVGTTADATLESGEQLPSGASGSDVSVWYKLDIPPASSGSPPSSVSLSATVLPNQPTGLVLGAWSGGTLGSLTSLAASSGGGSQASLTIPSGTSGTSGTVYVSVDAPQTWFFLDLSEQNVAPPDTAPPVVSCTPPSGWTSSPDVPCTASDSGSPLQGPSDASFRLVADVPPGVATPNAETSSRQVCDDAGNCTTVGPYTIEVDRSAPVVDCTPAPAGWSAANVAITCTSSDTGSGLADSADASFTLSTSVLAGSESAAASFPTHGPVCDEVGNCTAVPDPGTVKVDRQAPRVHCDSPATGWLDAQGSVACTAHDDGAGLAESSEKSFSLSTSVSPATADNKAYTNSVRVCDAVGNCTTAGPVGPFEVDLSVPVVNCALPKGWTKGTSVEIACTASDSGSGLSPSSPSSFTLSATIPSGTDQTATTGSQKICSVAGDCTTAGPFNSIGLADKAPQITCSSAPSTWQAGAVTVECAASAPGPGLADPSDAQFSLVASVPAGTTSNDVAFPQKTVCDTVGNCATSPSLPTVSIDETPPVVHCDPVPSGVQHEEVIIACTASDSGSGLADAADSSFDLRTSVGAGNADATAPTSNLQVCDAVGNCVTAGPYTADVDLRSAPSAAPPRIVSPGTVLVLVAIADRSLATAEFPVPYGMPATVGGVGTVQSACSPGPAALFRLGLTLVTCGATDQADQATEANFWVSAAAAPSLAPSGDAVQGGEWRAVGAGYAPGSPVEIDLGSTQLASATTDSDGGVDDVVTVPLATPIGDETLVVRGSTASGEPLLVVTPIVVNVSTSHVTTKTVSSGAPTTALASISVPPRGPRLPPAHILPVAGRPNGKGGPGIGAATAPSGPTATSTPSTTSVSPTGSSVPSQSTHASGSHRRTSTSHTTRTHRSSGSTVVSRRHGRHRQVPPVVPTTAAGVTGVSTPTVSTPLRQRSPTTTGPASPKGTTATTAPPVTHSTGPPTTTAPKGPTGVAIRPTPPTSHHRASSSGDVAAIVGGTVGGVLVVLLLGTLLLYTRRRARGAVAGPHDGGPQEGS